MTTDQYADKIDRLSKLNLENILSLASADCLDAYYNRVFIKSKKTDGGNINYVSNNPVYINTKINSPKKLPPIGKTGRKKFESTGQPHKSTYFDSYKSFKKKIGKPILELQGELNSSFQNGLKKVDSGTYVISVPAKEANKIEGLQFGNGEWTGLGTIFKLNKEEKNVFFETFKRELKKGINGTGNR